MTHVKLTPDLRLARVFVTLLELEDVHRADALESLRRAAPFLRRRLAEELSLRHAPEVAFAYDTELEQARRIEALLRDLRQTRESEDDDLG